MATITYIIPNGGGKFAKYRCRKTHGLKTVHAVASSDTRVEGLWRYPWKMWEGWDALQVDIVTKNVRQTEGFQVVLRESHSMPYIQCLSLNHEQSSVQKSSAQSYTALYVSRYICSSVSFKSKLLRHASGKFPLNGSLNRLYFSFSNRSINTSKHTDLMFLHRLHVANKIFA